MYCTKKVRDDLVWVEPMTAVFQCLKESIPSLTASPTILTC